MAAGYRAAYKAGRLQDAASGARLTVERARGELGAEHRFTAAQTMNLAGILAELGDVAGATEAYRSGTAGLTAALGAGNRDVLRARQDFARFLNRNGNYREALSVLRAIHADLAQSAAVNDPAIVDVVQDLAAAYRRLGRLREAEPFYQQVLDALQQRLGGQHPRVAGALNNLALLKRQTGELPEAERLLVRAVGILQISRGADHPSTATALDSLGGVRLARGQYRLALEDLQTALAVFRDVYTRDHPRLAQSLNNVAVALLKLGRPEQAEEIQNEHMEMVERLFDQGHPAMATAQINMAAIQKRLARFDEAGDYLQEALVIREAALGREHPQTIAVLNNLATLYQEQARFADAERLLRDAQERADRRFPGDRAERATVLHNLGNLLRHLGRDDEAEKAVQAALDIRERVLGPRHPDTADSMEAMGALRQAQGRYGEAEPFFLRAVELREDVLGPEHPDLANGLRNLATLLALSGRVSDGRTMLLRAQQIYETALGEKHPAVAGVLAALADFDRRLNLPSLAVASLEEALSIRIQAFDALHPEVALTMADLGGAYLAQGDADKALEQFRTAQAIIVTAFGAQHRRAAQALNNMAGAESVLGRRKEAEAHYRQALDIQSAVLGPTHPDLATTWGNLAALLNDAGRDAEALEAIRTASDILEQRLLGPAASVLESQESERKNRRDTFLFRVDLALREAARTEDRALRGQLIAEAFYAAQLAQSSKAARAIARTAARFAARDDEQAQQIRQRQDLATYLSRLEEAFIGLLNRPDAAERLQTRERLRAEVFSTRRKLNRIDRTLEERYPRYQELTNPSPLALKQAQALLHRGEGMLVVMVDHAKTYTWALTSDSLGAHVAAIGADEVADMVAELRDGVDLSGGAELDNLPRFDTRLAHELYARLLQPAMPTLSGLSHVFVVADGAMSGLPIGLLVTETQDVPPLSPEEYRQVPWLAMQVALTVLPTTSSLRAVRAFRQQQSATQPFLGIGDPVLEGGDGDDRGAVRGIYRNGGGLADVSRVRQLARLPDTRTELTAIAASLGATGNAVLLGTEATEERVRNTDLSSYRLISFATHGLVAGELQGLPEPALVLTPPAEASSRDDGLLTASEITGLTLNADLVILSACNTAAGDRPDGEGFSGLASAFIYAGGRALMASHWPVASGATQALTQLMFDDGAQIQRIGTAERLRRAMASLMHSPDHPEYAHPAFWAPFVVIGGGGNE